MAVAPQPATVAAEMAMAVIAAISRTFVTRIGRRNIGTGSEPGAAAGAQVARVAFRPQAAADS